MTIQEILDSLKVPYHQEGQHHHSRPGWVQLDCPLCGPGSQKYHLGYNLQLKYFNCWRCGGLYGPKVLEALGIGREKARLILGNIDTEYTRGRERARVSLVEPPGRGPLLRSHRRYLESRGFDARLIEGLWQIEGIGNSTELAWRIYIPIIHRAQRVSWTTRAIGDRVAQRYISASAEQESINHKEICYGLDFCHHSVVIVEGPTDAWNIGPGASALFGTTFSAAQVRKLIKIPMRYVCFDSSKEAQNRAVELANQLSVFPGITENIQLNAKDPGSASPKEIKLLKRVARL